MKNYCSLTAHYNLCTYLFQEVEKSHRKARTDFINFITKLYCRSSKTLSVLVWWLINNTCFLSEYIHTSIFQGNANVEIIILESDRKFGNFAAIGNGSEEKDPYLEKI